MGLLRVDVDGVEARYYDNARMVLVDSVVIGTIDEGALDLFRDDSREEHDRSWEVLREEVRRVVRARRV